MAITLLDMLLEAGMLTPRQIDDALQHRIFYGGKIGTNLVELGFLREEDLAKFLGRKLGVGYVAPEKLLAIPADVIALLPRELALKYKAIPLLLDRNRLHLVMADPADLPAIDDIAFITGHLVKPLITPEFRLIQALGQYYQMEISPRYQKILDRLNAEAPPPPPKAQAAEPAAVPPPAAPLPKAEPVAAAQDPALATAAPVTAAAAPDEGAAELLEELEVVEDESLAARVGRYSITDISRSLSRVEDREEIAALLTEYLGNRFSCAALFIVRGDVASGWRAYRNGREIEGFDLLHIPFTRASVLKTVTEGKSYYLGPLAETPLNARLVEGLGGKPPASALILPLVVSGRVVDVLYLEREGKDLSSQVVDVQKLLVKAAYAFELLICREKILVS